ncbi:MAG: flagellar hook-length control protein FliK [Sedimentisphaerales bacterium]|nr:flagellar hook-length control protein FliK [Sedimentisphaerales bacterium]
MSSISIQMNVSNSYYSKFDANKNNVSQALFEFNVESGNMGGDEILLVDKIEKAGQIDGGEGGIEKEGIPKNVQDTASKRSEQKCRESRDEINQDPESEISDESQVVGVKDEVNSRSEDNIDESAGSDKSNDDFIIKEAAELAEKSDFVPIDILQTEIKSVLSEKNCDQTNLSDGPGELIDAANNVWDSEELGWKTAQGNIAIDTKIALSAKDQSHYKLLPEIPVSEGIMAVKIANEKGDENGNPVDGMGGKNVLYGANAISLETKDGISLQKLQYADTESIKSEFPVKGKNDEVTGDFRVFSESTVNSNKEFQNALNVTTAGSAVEKEEILNVKISSEQTRGRNDLSFDNYSTSEFSQMVSHGGHDSITELRISSTENLKTDSPAKQSALDDINTDVGRQILESIRSSLQEEGAGKQIIVRLNPPELGQVSIKFEDRNAELTGLLEVSKTQTRNEIEQVLPQIIRNLSDSGIDIKKIDVVLTSNGQMKQEAQTDQSFLSDGQQHNSGEQGLFENNRDTSGVHEWLAHSINYGNDSRGQASLAVDNSINVLI